MAFNLFNSIRVKTPKRHAFDLSHDVKMSCDLYKLVPILCEEVVPGDTWKVNTEILMRFAPLSSPVMHRLNVYTHFFFVPKRLVWDGWKDFITGGEYRPGKKDPNESPAYPKLLISARVLQSHPGILSKGSLADYLGFPVGDLNQSVSNVYDVASNIDDTKYPLLSSTSLDALPFRAYNLIWNEYYRDQNLQDPIDIHQETSGEYDGLGELGNLLFRAWEKDYFTSALPWPQAGDDVHLPLYGSADVTIPKGSIRIDGAIPGSGNGTGPVFASRSNAPGSNNVDGKITLQNPDGDELLLINKQSTKLQNSVDLSNVSAATINEFRRAVRAQEFLEKSARGGSRYIEQLLSFFGVRSSDARLQRPEYLGGGKSPVVISDVAQTSQTTQDTSPGKKDGSPQGNLSGQAASLQRSHSFKRYFEEHGYIIGIMSVLPRTCYQQGMPRKYTKFTREDQYWPTFANLGEQEIKNSEIYFNNLDGENDGTFGYTPRYAEYKYLPSRVCGDFRDTLSYWHMGRIFKNRPNLNGNFITSSGDGRIFADMNDDYQKLWVNIYHNITAVRPMPVYGTPML